MGLDANNAFFYLQNMFSELTHFFFLLLLLDVFFMLMASRFWIFDLFINFVPQFLVLDVLCIVLLLAQGNWGEAAVLCFALVYFGRPLIMLYISPSQNRVSGGTPLTILQTNVNENNTRYNLLIDHIHSRKPSIIMLNEVRKGWIDALRKEFGEAYPFIIDLSSDAYSGMAVLSQLPIASHEVFRPTKESSPLIRVRLQNLPLTIYVAHPVPPLGKSWATQRDMFFQFLASDAKEIKGDMLVVGDLNTTIFSPLLRGLLQTTGLSLDRKGFGWKPSWMYGTPIALPIDHILYRGSMIMTKLQILSTIGSDHRPVLATFEYAP
jgi:endonuclease/exonuclease/phosphatase (EEP) superfamily protein YafD